MLNRSSVAHLLPPANEVWGKVIFLHQFVILFTGGECVVARGVCMVLFGGACMVLFGGMHGFIWGGMCGFICGGYVVLFGGACVVFLGGCACFFLVFSDTMRYGQ